MTICNWAFFQHRSHGDLVRVTVALFMTEGTMPYATGEIPVVGDYVKNLWDQPGIVLEVRLAHGDVRQDHVSVRWDDGGVDLPLRSATEFKLISRCTSYSTNSKTA
jgi:hypothetical protein